MAKRRAAKNGNGANLGFEEKLWAAADKQPTIGRTIDDQMAAIEKDNPMLKGVLLKDYGRASLDKQRLGKLIDLVGTIGLGDAKTRSKDVLGRVYEYFLGEFASPEGKGGGEFYTPQSVVKLLVEMIEPDSKSGKGARSLERGHASTTPVAAAAACSCRAKNCVRPQRPRRRPFHLRAGEQQLSERPRRSLTRWGKRTSLLAWPPNPPSAMRTPRPLRLS